MKILVILSAVFFIALVSAQIDRENLNYASQMVRSENSSDPNPSSSASHSDSSSSSESDETLADKIKKGLKILKTKFYSAKNCTLIPPPSLHELHEFFQWTVTHNKTYGTVAEKFCRTIHLIHNFRENHQHNKLFKLGKATFKRALNHLSDLTKREIRTVLMKFAPSTSTRSDPLTALPQARRSVDWRKEGLVGPVGFQYNCGNCWAWASAAVLEGQLRKCRISNESVSVQSMVDCATEYCEGCDGGWPYYGMKWAIDGGIIPTSKYPYLDGEGYCVDRKQEAIGFVDTPYVHDFYYGDAEYIKRIVSSYGPVAVALCVGDDFTHYSSGVFYINNCCTTVNHAISIVGYGSDPKLGDYWLIKNSWDLSWGQDGFAKVARGHNLCSIESTVHYAQIKDVKGNVCRIPK
ncbi:unnamed protein product [Chironomus riparius]|uniref:Uncharacterized protein n=1 Tax=Chironomus riparius TaxID=315576 RepID=A0A9N9S5H5_9DIPT|nr:unnamed protein product [Chironomus riparius]